MPRYVESAVVEAQVLEKISRLDLLGVSRCVRLVEHFPFTRHGDKYYVLIFEPLGKSLYDVIKDNDYRGKFPQVQPIDAGFSISLVRSFASQLFQSLAFLHGIGLTHTDLKVLPNVR